MSLREPDLEGWNRYDPQKVPDEKRRLILRKMSDNGVPMYQILTILRKETGLTDYCLTYWKSWNGKGTHWAWLDELKVVKTNK